MSRDSRKMTIRHRQMDNKVIPWESRVFLFWYGILKISFCFIINNQIRTHFSNVPYLFRFLAFYKQGSFTVSPCLSICLAVACVLFQKLVLLTCCTLSTPTIMSMQNKVFKTIESAFSSTYKNKGTGFLVYLTIPLRLLHRVLK